MVDKRSLKHTYIVQSTDPMTGFLSKTGTPMLLPVRFTKFRRSRGKSLSLVNKDDVRIYMKEVEDGRPEED